MYSQGRQASGQPFKFSVMEICDRIKEEFQFLQAQYNSLKLECEKLTKEKTEMQRHYVMYYEMSYGLNIELHRQAEIVKRLTAICAQIIPLLSQEHQIHVLGALDRAKLVTMAELNTILGRQQLQLLSHQAPLLPLTPRPSGSQASSLAAVSTTRTSGLLAASGTLGAQSPLGPKQENSGQDSPKNQGKPQSRNNSVSSLESMQDEERRKDCGAKAKLQDKEEESEEEKSDCNLIVDEEAFVFLPPPLGRKRK